MDVHSPKNGINRYWSIPIYSNALQESFSRRSSQSSHGNVDLAVWVNIHVNLGCFFHRTPQVFLEREPSQHCAIVCNSTVTYRDGMRRYSRNLPRAAKHRGIEESQQETLHDTPKQSNRCSKILPLLALQELPDISRCLASVVRCCQFQRLSMWKY